jgi:chaperone modulatory protein CbpM
MMRAHAVAALFADLDEAELIVWVERGWVRPEAAEADWVFQEIDVARVRLIHDLRRRMEVNDEALPLILSLLDQVYDLRSQLRAVLRAVEQQPEPVQRAILAVL